MTTIETKTAEIARKFADKLFRIERFSQEQVDTVIAAIFDGKHDTDAVKKIIDDFKAANLEESQKVARRIEEIVAAETVTENVDALGRIINRDVANDNNQPVYEAEGRTRGGNFIYGEFATAIAAFTWLNKKTGNAIEIERGHVKIVRYRKDNKGKLVYFADKDGSAIFAGDEPEFKTFLYAKPNVVSLVSDITKPSRESETVATVTDTPADAPLDVSDVADLKAKYDATDEEAARKFADKERADKEHEIATAVCETLTAVAPHGWTVTLTKGGDFKVINHGDTAAELSTITAGDFLDPKAFFDRFKSERERTDDEREDVLRQLNAERKQLFEMRTELAEKYPHETERLKTLDEMIHETDADIAAFESLVAKPNATVTFDKKGNVKDVWF